MVDEIEGATEIERKKIRYGGQKQLGAGTDITPAGTNAIEEYYPRDTGKKLKDYGWVTESKTEDTEGAPFQNRGQTGSKHWGNAAEEREGAPGQTRPAANKNFYGSDEKAKSLFGRVSDAAQDRISRMASSPKLKSAVKSAVATGTKYEGKARAAVESSAPVQSMIAPYKNPVKQTFAKGVVQGSKQFSRAVASAPKKPVTGGKVGKIPQPFPVQPNEDRFVNMLFGGSPQPQRQQKVGKQGKQQPPQQQQTGIDPMAPLNNLMRRII